MEQCCFFTATVSVSQQHPSLDQNREPTTFSWTWGIKSPSYQTKSLCWCIESTRCISSTNAASCMADAGVARRKGCGISNECFKSE